MEELRKKYQAAYKKILASQKVFLLGHLDPDLDALSSISVLIEFLKEQGKSYLAYAKNKGDNFFFLPHEEKILPLLPENFSLKNFDLIIIVDCATIERTSLKEELLEIRGQVPIIEFDHHPKNEEYADIEIRSQHFSSNTENLYYFFKENNLKINKIMATSLLAGIMTDTNNFFFPSTTKETIDISSELLSLGASFPKINQSAYQNKSLLDMKLLGLASKNLRYNHKYQLAYSFISQKDLIELASEKEITEFSSNNDIYGEIAAFLSNLAGAKAILLFREEKDGRLKCNLRSSNPKVNVSTLAQIFGGGGHSQASGFSWPGKLKKEKNNYQIELD